MKVSYYRISMRIYFIRHGNTFEKNDIPKQIGLQTDLPLTDKGKEQIISLKNYFFTQNIIPSKIFCGQ